MECESTPSIPISTSPHIFWSNTDISIPLREGRAEERVAKLVDSPDRPESEASYKLDEGGWADV